MEIKMMPRGSGKTLACIRYAIAHNCILIVATEASKQRIEKDWAEAVRSGILKVVVANRYKIGEYNSNDKVVVDDIDGCLRSYIGANIEFGTLTPDGMIGKYPAKDVKVSEGCFINMSEIEPANRGMIWYILRNEKVKTYDYAVEPFNRNDKTEV